MFQRAVLKAKAKQLILDNLSQVMLISLLLAVIYLLLDGISLFNGNFRDFLKLLLNGVLGIPFSFFILQLWRNGTARSEDFFSSFSGCIKWMLAGLWQYLWIVLWMLLLVVPGIVKAFSYSQYYFILADNPDADLREALKTSMRMTEGHKGELFVAVLSFSGWYLLAGALIALSVYLLFPLSILMRNLLAYFIVVVLWIWVRPYMSATFAGIYEELKRDALERRICTPDEFGLSDAAEERATIDTDAYTFFDAPAAPVMNDTYNANVADDFGDAATDDFDADFAPEADLLPDEITLEPSDENAGRE